MIVWINGTYAVGKTTIAYKLTEKLGLESSIVIDADYYYQNEFTKKYPYSAIFLGIEPQSNKCFLKYFKDKIEMMIQEKELVVIPMAITLQIGKNELIEYFSQKHDFVHIILEAEKETVIFRMQNDNLGNRDISFCLENLDRNIFFLNENFPDALRVCTERITVNDIVGIINDYLKCTELKGTN